MLLRLLLLTPLLLTSCKGPVGRYIMRPAGEFYDRDCVYHNYGGLPKCKNYNFLPVDKPLTYIRQEVVINDYSQYKGN